ncbi:hypothetical protein LCGC14_1287620, partial [marine sediment metagenome]
MIFKKKYIYEYLIPFSLMFPVYWIIDAISKNGVKFIPFAGGWIVSMGIVACYKKYHIAICRTAKCKLKKIMLLIEKYLSKEKENV